MKINKNIYIKTARTVLLGGACFHLALLALFALIHQDINLVNVFSILDLKFLNPELGQGVVNFVLGWIIMLLIYLVVLYYYSRTPQSSTPSEVPAKKSTK
jgi:hypothetical protein